VAQKNAIIVIADQNDDSAICARMMLALINIADTNCATEIYSSWRSALGTTWMRAMPITQGNTM
jgi:hypothetical protein